MASKTKKPTGLSITRENLKFTLAWTPNKKYKKQQVSVFIDDAKDPVVEKLPNIEKNTKKASYTIPQESYQPTTDVSFSIIRFKVKGKIGKKWYEEEKKYSVKHPGILKYIKPEKTDDGAYTYKYSWDRNENDSNDDTIIFKEYQWDTVLVASNVDSGKMLDEKYWKQNSSQQITMIDINTGQTIQNHASSGSTTDGSIIIVDSPSVVSRGLRRFVRVRAIGAAGPSDYQYSDHAFSAPSSSSIESATIKISDSEKIAGSVKINTDISNNQPIDNVSIQYAVTKPKTVASTVTIDGVQTRKIDITIPEQGISWNTYRTFDATGNQMGLDFTIDTPLDENECLFIRTNVVHDNETVNSSPKLITPPQGYGILSAPSITSCTVNPANHTVNIAVNNTTDLDNNKSFVAVFFRTSEKQNPEKPIGIIPYGTTSGIFKYPEIDESQGNNISFGVQAFVANYSPATYDGTLTYFNIGSQIKMKSNAIIWDNGSLPLPPNKITATRLKAGTIHVTWNWPWIEANSAELSWSDDPDAWESTNEPSTYVVSNFYSGQWNISGLNAGTWYIKIRLLKTTDELTVYGTYSEMMKVNLSSAPNTPALTLEPNVIAVDGTTTAYWEFSSTDGTSQSYAELAEAEEVNGSWRYTPLPNATTNTGKSISFSPSDYGWANGSKHYISIKVTSGSGMAAEWSKPVELNVASKPVINVTGFNWSTAEDANNVLAQLPLSFTVTGAGKGGYATAIITRRQGFDIPRPNDSNEHGYEGEVIVSRVISNKESASFSFNVTDKDLVGHFDDDALYKLDISVTDSYGQTAKSLPYNFSVKWNEQAVMPSATVTINHEDGVAFIRPIQPSGYTAGAYCDIYRLSADRPELIVHKAAFNTTYVDPYPTYGLYGGYRVVYITKYGDHRLDTGESSWADYGPTEEEVEYRTDYFDKFAITIDFDDESIDLPYDISLSNTWNKDFTTTKYLGGSQEGDWTPGVSRTGSYKVRIPVEQNKELVYKSRLLADYAGVCHVRTPEGSNFYANVDVSEEREAKWVNRISSLTFNITKVDSIGEDGMTYTDWSAEDQ